MPSHRKLAALLATRLSGHRQGGRAEGPRQFAVIKAMNAWSTAPVCLAVADVEHLHVGAFNFTLVLLFVSFAIIGKKPGRSWAWSFRSDPFRPRAKKSFEKDSYLVRAVEVLFHTLQWLSPATWRFGTRAASHNNPELSCDEPKRAQFVEKVVALWVPCCALALWSLPITRWTFGADVVCVCALIRVADILQAHVNAHVWDVRRVLHPQTEHVSSLQRSLLLAAINYFELIGWFAVVYSTFGLVKGASRVSDYLYFSAITQLTIGYGDLTPLCGAKLLAPLQAMLGTMLLVVGVARLVAGIRPPVRQQLERNARWRYGTRRR